MLGRIFHRNADPGEHANTFCILFCDYVENNKLKLNYVEIDKYNFLTKSKMKNKKSSAIYNLNLMMHYLKTNIIT